MIVGYPVIFIFCLYKIEHGFKFTDDNHVAVDPQEISGGEVFLLRLNRFVILINIYSAEFNELRLPYYFRIDVLTFRHVSDGIMVLRYYGVKVLRCYGLAVVQSFELCILYLLYIPYQPPGGWGVFSYKLKLSICVLISFRNNVAGPPSIALWS